VIRRRETPAERSSTRNAAAMTASTTVAEAASLVGDTGGGTSAAKGSEIYDFVRKHQCESCLEHWTR
jgi:hypothetical protein